MEQPWVWIIITQSRGPEYKIDEGKFVVKNFLYPKRVLAFAFGYC